MIELKSILTIEKELTGDIYKLYQNNYKPKDLTVVIGNKGIVNSMAFRHSDTLKDIDSLLGVINNQNKNTRMAYMGIDMVIGELPDGMYYVVGVKNENN